MGHLVFTMGHRKGHLESYLLNYNGDMKITTSFEK